MRLDPETVKTLTASTATHVAAIAQSEALVPMLAAAWTEMTLRQPRGASTIRAVLGEAARKAEQRGDGASASRYRIALKEFEARCFSGAENAATSSDPSAAKLS